MQRVTNGTKGYLVLRPQKGKMFMQYETAEYLLKQWNILWGGGGGIERIMLILGGSFVRVYILHVL